MNPEVTIAISTTNEPNVLEVLGLRITNGVKTVVGETTLELNAEDYEKVKTAIALLNDLATPKPVEEGEGQEVVATEEVKEVKSMTMSVGGKEYTIVFVETENGVNAKVKEIGKEILYANMEDAHAKVHEDVVKLVNLA